MGTVFSASINKILDRVYRKALLGESTDGHEFEKILRDLDQSQTAPSHAEDSPKLSQPAQETSPQPIVSVGPPALCNEDASGVLSNLTLGETGHARGEMRFSPITQNSTEVPVDALRFVSLEPHAGVKELSPQPTLPPAPEMVSAVRYMSSTYAAMDTPKQRPLENVQIPEKLREIQQIIAQAGKAHGVDPNLSFAVAKAESALKTYAISQDGHASKGLFQLLDTTGKDMMARLGTTGAYQPFDAKQNSHLGVAYLKRLHTLFGKESNLGYNLRTVPASSAADLEKLAVAAFNAGEGRVARAQARAKALGKDPGDYSAVEPHLPSTTRAYVKRVLDYRVALNGRISVDESA